MCLIVCLFKICIVERITYVPPLLPQKSLLGSSSSPLLPPSFLFLQSSVGDTGPRLGCVLIGSFDLFLCALFPVNWLSDQSHVQLSGKTAS